ncbi:MAG: efflux RND transporter periplasmic adaptor subunit [Clostridiales bacterium]|nr:efflux RND transporter periplasmic adaptor subunit [Clostridiales bacterium]
MNKKSVIIGGVIVVILGFAIATRLLNTSQFAEAVADPVVEVTAPEKRDISLITGLVGSVEPEDVVYIYPKVSGEVREVYIKAGEVVQAGDAICEIDTKQVENAKNSLDAAELALSQAQDDLSRQSVLYAGGGISEQAYKQYQDAVTSAQISYNDAKVNYDNQISYSQFIAPITGLIEVCNIEKFDQVSTSDLLCVISGRGARVVSFYVTERVKNQIREGDLITVEKDGEEYEGTVYEVSVMADSDTGLFKIKARMDESMDEYVLPTGSSVKLYVTSQSVQDVMAIPVDSVYYDGGLSYVYTYDADGSILHKVQVETGLYDSDWIEIQSGLSYEDQVLTTWSSELGEGTSVRLKETSVSTAGASETEADSSGTTDETASSEPTDAAA